MKILHEIRAHFGIKKRIVKKGNVRSKDFGSKSAALEQAGT